MTPRKPVKLKNILKFLEDEGAEELPHGRRRTLNDHLKGTMKILSHWRQPNQVIAAGLLHSIYSTDRYQEQLVPLSQRRRVREVAGESAERWVYLFGSLRRADFFEQLKRVEGTAWESLQVESHRDSRPIAVSRRDAGSLLVIYMANAAEQVCQPNRAPGSWLSAASQWGLWARPLTQRVPPIFSHCLERVSTKEEQAARRDYAAGLQKIVDDRRTARSHFVAANRTLPFVAEPLILLSFAACLDGRFSDAFLHATTGLALLRQLGTAWDKRLSYADWESIANGIVLCADTGMVEPVRAEKMFLAVGGDSLPEPAKWREMLKSVSMDRLVQAARPLPAVRNQIEGTAQILPQRFASYMASFGTERGSSRHNHYQGLRKQTVYPAGRFALARALSESWQDIRSEFLGLRPREGFQKEIEKIPRTGDWTIYTLFELGRRNDVNCARCPVTASIVEQYGSTQSISNAAYFSIMAPETHIAAHRGPTNMRLRCHLGIEIPERCRLRVGNETLTWREGECIVFDDSFVHEVWNDSEARRVVLVVDLWHPDLTEQERELLEGLNRYAYTHAKGMDNYWTKNEQARKSFSSRAAPAT